MPETTPLIKAALNLRVGAGFDVYSYLANGEDVLAAGVIRLDSNGVVTEIKNESGHYKPTPNQTIVSIKLFEQFGIDLHGVTINNKTYT